MDIRSYLSWGHVAIASAVYFVSIAFYRLFIHPLADFPGPKLAAITRYYEGYYDIIRNGQYTFKIAEMHKKYGPIIRISPHELHVNDQAFFDKLYRQDGRWNKYDWSVDAFSTYASTACSVDHDVHKQRRAPLNPFFSKANVASKQEIMHRLTKRLCGRIAGFASSKTPVDLGAAVSAFSRDLANEFILATTYDDLGEEDFNAELTNTIQGGGGIWRITKHVRWFGPLIKSLPTSFVEKMGDEGTKSFFAFLKKTMQITEDAISTYTKAPDSEAPLTIMHSILQSNLPTAEKTATRIHDEVVTITGAAFETTAQTLRLVIYHIYRSPAVLRRLRSELAAAKASAANNTVAGGDATDLDLASLERLPYLTAVLTEGLRLSPGIATRTARIAPDRDLIYGQWRIPAGTPVGMTTLLLHLDESAYPEPRRFDPERWMDGDRKAKRGGTLFAPFMKGTRNCLGRYLAWAELYIVVAALVLRFNLAFDGVQPEDMECVGDQFILRTRVQGGLKAVVSTRDG